MIITKERFIELANLYCPQALKSIDILYDTEGKIPIAHKLRSKLWRLNNLYKVVDINNQLVRFQMNEPQLITYFTILIHRRLIILKSRQLGISTLFLVDYADEVIHNRYFYTGLMAQNREIASMLLERVKILWDNYPLKDYFGLEIKKKNKSDFMLNNDSIMYINTSFRGGTLGALHISEMGKICNESPKKANEVMNGTLQTIHHRNRVAIESTAEGENKYKTLYEDALETKKKIEAGYKKDPMEFYPHFLNFMHDDRFKSETKIDYTKYELNYFAELEEKLNQKIPNNKKAMWAIKYRQLGDYVFQEYPMTEEEAFLNRNAGYYFAKLFAQYIKGKKQIITGLFNPAYPVQLAMDLGMNDYNCIGFVQALEGKQMSVIDCYYSYNRDIAFYAEKIMAISKEKGYGIDENTHLILPHDASVKEMTSGMTRKDTYFKYGFHNITLLGKLGFMDSIEVLRKQIVDGLWMDEYNTQYLQECLKRYTKEWDEKTNQFKRKPRENEYYHGTDMLRYAAQGLLWPSEESETPEIFVN